VGSSPRIIDLRAATLEQLISAIFDESAQSFVASDSLGDGDWLEYDVDPHRQVLLLAALFRRSGELGARFPSDTIERGLWRIMGGEFSSYFTEHLWNPEVPRANRIALIDTVYHLYDDLLARRPLEAIDFRHPDFPKRRFAAIDYMVPDLLLEGGYFRDAEREDQAAIRDAFLTLFGRMLRHPSPISQYAALHGLGHLQHERGSELIDTYIAGNSDMSADQRDYAVRARVGEVL
jgi:hypothetical protein